MDKTMASPWTLWSPQVQPAATGRRPQRRRRRLRSAQEGALIRRLGLVDFCRRSHPKLALGALGRK